MYRRAYAAPQRGCLCVATRLRRAILRLPVPRLRRAEFVVRRADGGVPQCGCLCEAPRLRRAMLRLPVPRLSRARWCWLAPTMHGRAVRCIAYVEAGRLA